MAINIQLGGYICPSLIDWDGKVVCTLFMAGCNFDCPFCHNAELIPLDSGTTENLDVISTILEQNSNFIDGVVISGGEPTIQGNNLVDLCALIRDFDLEIKLDTNGSNPSVVEELLIKDLVDRVAVDIKAPDHKYQEATGLIGKFNPVHRVYRTLALVNRYDKELEIRTTIIPGLNNSLSDIHLLGMTASRYVSTYYLQQFIPDNVKNEEYRKRGKPSYDELIKLADRLVTIHGLDVLIRHE